MDHSTSPAPLPPTPAWVIDEPQLKRYLNNFQRALQTYWPNSILGYSFKTNSLPWLVTWMREQGAWAETVSDHEYNLALAVGFTPDQVVFNGPIKGRERFRHALDNGAILNIDSRREVAWAAELAAENPGKDYALGLRVNWDLVSRCPEERVTGDYEESRFGFDVDNGDFDWAIDELQAAGVRVAGLHMHRNSLTQGIDVFRASATVASELIVSRGLELDWVDIGGGFFGRETGFPTFDDYVKVIRDTLEPFVDTERTRLIVEPGASLVAVPFEFHASVLDTKEINGTTFVTCDGSRTDIDPLFRRQRPFAVNVTPAGTETQPSVDEQVVGGFTLMEDDRITILENQPALQIGDHLQFLRVGGYTMCLQTMFIENLPAVYVRGEDGELRLVRRAWEVGDFLQGNTWLEAGQPSGGMEAAAAG